MQRLHQNANRRLPLHSKTTAVETTLYDLIKAVTEEVKSGEDHLVSVIVKDMLSLNRAVSRLQ